MNKKPLSQMSMTLILLWGCSLSVSGADHSASVEIPHPYGFLSLLPPLLAIILAIVTRKVLLALFAGVWGGTFLLYNYNPLTSLYHIFDIYAWNVISDTSNLTIILFSLMLGGMVGIITRSGGTRGMVSSLSRLAKTDRSVQVSTWIMGHAVFFDDYANCLIVGNTMRPLSDKFRISREKLAYIVDSTAAPVATIALISTWVGYKVSLISKEIPDPDKAYSIFLAALPYSFYSIFTLAFVLMIALFRRDFGPMLKAEQRARQTGKLLRDGATPMASRISEPTQTSQTSWILAGIPLLSILLFMVCGLYYSGIQNPETFANASIQTIISNADSFAVLLWASVVGSVIAASLAIGTRTMTFTHTLRAWINGCGSLVMAIVILIFAWSIGMVCKDLLTGNYVMTLIGHTIAPLWIPTIVFVLSALIALSTGTSFGTMSIALPIVIPLLWGHADMESVRLPAIAAVLGGSVFGDHCSPLSDTTVMSSMSAGSDHIDHVRTQLPYGLVCAITAIICGYIPAGFGISPLITLPTGILVLALLIRTVGKHVHEQ